MKKNFILLIAALTVVLVRSEAQKLKTYKDHCGFYYTSVADLQKQKGRELAFFSFKPGQYVASLGAQCCHWEAAYAAASDSVHFFLEDIDSSYFNAGQASFAWNHYEQLLGKPLSSSWRLVVGTEHRTNLPENLFDKILIINSFHEFTDQLGMLADIRRKLKPEGILYIDETLAKHSGELHGVCKKRIYLSDELINILQDNGYEYVNSLDMNFRKGRVVRKIFAFRKNKT